MKKIAKSFVVALAALCMFGCSKSDNNRIKMITEATFPPYEFLRGHEVVGIDVEICRTIAQKLGKELAVENVNFDAVIAAVVSGKADIAAAGITVNEDRKKNVDFSIPYVKTGIVAIYKKATGYKSPADFKGKRIGVQGGTTSETYVIEELKQEPERMRSPAEGVAAMRAGRVDYVIADIDPAKNCVKGESDLAISDFLTSEEYAIAIAKGKPELLKVINETIAELKTNGKIAEWVRSYTEESDKLKDK